MRPPWLRTSSGTGRCPSKTPVRLARYCALRNCTGGGRSFHLMASQLLKNPHPHADEPPSTLLLTCSKHEMGDHVQTCSVLTFGCTGPTYAPKETFPALEKALPLHCPGSGVITLPSAESRFPKVQPRSSWPLTPAELSGLSLQHCQPCRPRVRAGDEEEHSSLPALPRNGRVMQRHCGGQEIALTLIWDLER